MKYNYEKEKNLTNEFTSFSDFMINSVQNDLFLEPVVDGEILIF